MTIAIFPSQILLPLVVDEKWRSEILKTLPELPEARRKRMVADYGISEQDAGVLTLTRTSSRSVRRGGQGGEESQARGQSGPERTDGTPESQGPGD